MQVVLIPLQITFNGGGVGGGNPNSKQPSQQLKNILFSPQVSELKIDVNKGNEELSLIKSTSLEKLWIAVPEFGIEEFTIPVASQSDKSRLKDLTIRILRGTGDPQMGHFNPETSLGIGSIPLSVTKLTISLNFFKHNPKLIPDSVTDLTVLQWDLATVEKGILPMSPSIHTLILYAAKHSINTGIKVRQWPDRFFPPNLSVLKIIGETQSYSKLCAGELPDTIKKLVLEPYFEFEIGSIPSSVKIFKLLHNNEKVFHPGIIPFGCEFVKIGFIVHKNLLVGSIPESVNRLIIGNSFQHIVKGLFPSALTRLEVTSNKTRFKIPKSGPTFAQLFPLMNHLHCPFTKVKRGDYDSTQYTIPPYSIPYSVLELTIDQKQNLTPGILPPNLNTLYCKVLPKTDPFSTLSIPNSLQNLTLLNYTFTKDTFNEISKLITQVDKNPESQLSTITLSYSTYLKLINYDKNDPYLYFHSN
eukprot:gene11404-13969_t